jgi:hypothetical protein
MDDPLRQAEARLERYWNVDGLHEIGVALILALTALWVWATELSDLPQAWKRGFSTTFPFLLIGGMSVERVVIKTIRRRLTYPRAGFAEMRKPTGGRRLVSALAAAVIAAGIGFAGARFEPEQLRRWAVIVPGVAAGIFLWQIGSRAGVSRFYAAGALIAAASLAIAGAGMSMSLGLTLFWAIAAGVLLVSGGITLWRFLRT